MEITVKPYSKEYAKQCADLEQYLWKEDRQGRETRFEWAYANCPVYKKPLCVIAVDENDEVMGFRGYFLNKFVVNGKEVLVAQLSDTVVSDKARRQGIFQKMTNFSLPYLKDKGVSSIINLSPSWPPYYGYKKIGFEDLGQFHSKYKFNIYNLISQNLLKKDRLGWNDRKEISRSMNGLTLHVSQSVDDSVISQVNGLSSTERIHSSLASDILKWRTTRPGQHYVYAYATDHSGKLHSFAMFKTKDYYKYDMGVYLSASADTFVQLYRLLKRQYKPAIVAAWDFALDDESRSLLKKVGMVSIPFINKIRKNPPSLIRTLQTDQNGNLDWNIEGKDIRKAENWSIYKIDLDSF